MDNKFEVTFLGTNGSCAYNNGNRMKYGTNTLCVLVSAGSETLIFDSGSGICGFRGMQPSQANQIRLLFSHYHADHLYGLLFFPGFFDSQKQIELLGPNIGEYEPFNIVNKFLSPPLHPVGLNTFKANVSFRTIKTDEAILLNDGVIVHAYNVSHPGDAVAYRLEYGGKSFFYCSDIELRNHENDSKLLELMHNVDLLVLDSFLGDNTEKVGWGHSSWRECAEWAKRAEAKRLALIHYSFDFCDADIDSMERRAKDIFPNAFASADNMRVKL